MFTGIIETKGRVLEHLDKEGSTRLVIASPLKQTQAGESIAVNGVCLTLLPCEGDVLQFDLSPETLKITCLKDLSSGDEVNLERAVFGSSRFGGHYVSGHVDTTALVHALRPLGEYLELELSLFHEQAMLYLIPKGSITVDGVSLTINAVVDKRVILMLVPHTLAQTTLGSLKTGQQVNIEFDYLTRVVAHQLQLLGKLNNEVQL